MNTKIKYLVQTKDGLYRYKRKVPLALRELLRREQWNYSLGRDLEPAHEKWFKHKKRHDTLIERLKSGDPVERAQATADAVTIRAADHFAAMERLQKDGPRPGLPPAAITPEKQEREEEEDAAAIVGVQNLWSQTTEVMEHAEGTPNEYLRLATHLFMAFGDATYLEGNPVAPEELRPAPPSGGQRRLWDMLHAALLSRLEEIAPGVIGDDEHRLTSLRERYFKLHNLSAATQRSYSTKIDRMTAFMGDLTLQQITPDRLRMYRDYLMDEGLKPDSVAQYFSPVAAIMRWAISEELVPDFDALPTAKVKMPRAGTHIEDARWQRFDDEEIKTVWNIAQKAWGPKSRYSPDRQEAFKWAFRVALYTAARPVEIFRMKPENVTPDSIFITETKTGISRTLPLSKHLAGFHQFMQDGGWKLGKTKPESAAGTMSDSFTKAIRKAGFTNDRHVLYSTKDTLVDRLQRAGHSDDTIRGITGHVSGQGQLRNYKTRLNDSPEGLQMLRKTLDRIEYW
ncbi:MULTISPECIES: phage integrase SAM-like domain-containing protein [unclassified Sulfitobacter]|uniref:phage integrase SAM-like domain-containing protein n=1 Tax=unclassified Sulfitobacter TaxID=196795 RepID=UPI0037472968